MFIRKKLFLAAAIIAVMAPAIHVRADATSDARKAIQAQYDRQNAAFAKKDVNSAFAVYTSDRTETSPTGGKTTVASEKQSASALLATATSFKGTTTIQTISLKSTSATVRVKLHAVIVVPNPQTKKSTTMAVDTVSDDTWIKTGSKWLEKSSVEKSDKMTVDGKPVG